MARGGRSAVELVGTMLVLVFLLQGNAAANQEQTSSSPTQDDYRIAPGDEIDVQVEDAPELSMTYRVNASGKFLMRFLGAITAQHRTEKGLADVIADGLKRRYMKDPKVSVRIVRGSELPRSLPVAIDHHIFILGSVRNPGAYRIQGRATLSKLISLAGGLTETHGPIAYVLRRQAKQSDGSDRTTKDGPEYETTTVDIDRLLKGAISEEMTLQRGDVVSIPAADTFVVTGEVGAPGSFPFKQGMTLREAIVLARGLTANAVARGGVIFREDPTTGKRTEIKVDIAAITSGKSKDVALQPNDIIAVPSSRVKIFDRLRYLDSPPIPHFAPCRRSRPCNARLSWTEQCGIYQRDCV